MDSVYFALALGSGAAAAVLLYFRLKKRGENGYAALTAFVFCSVLGFSCAKAVYCLALARIVFPQWGLGALTRLKPGEFSFFGGMAGVCLGAVLAGKTARIRPAKMLDALAPCLALLVMALRILEYRLGMLGMGDEIENESLRFFPIAVTDEWGDWYLAIFMLEALCALAAAAGMLGREKKDAFPVGLIFRRTVFYLALPQILLESLRVECLKWGFVRIEQVLCTACVAGLILWACRQRKGAVKKPYRPMILVVLGVLGMVTVEFALDKFNPSTFLCYAVMALILLGLALLEIRCVKGRTLKHSSPAA